MQPSDNVVEFVSKAEQTQMIYAAVMLPLARMIQSGIINPETVTKNQFLDALRGLGTTVENAFEVHVTRIKEEIRLVAHCIVEDEAKSGVVLLFTLIEGEINSLIRMLLRIQGFPPNTITDALRGTDFDTKIDVMLPLLNVKVPERMRNTAFQCKAIRNLVVHNKATPNLMVDSGNKPSDEELASERASRFFHENPIERIQHDLEEFTESGINDNPAIRSGRLLLKKYYEECDA